MADGFRIAASSNVADVLARLDTLEAAIRGDAMAVALNKLGDQARVAGERQIRKTYGLTIDQFSKYIEVRFATRGGLSYTIIATGKGFPLVLFKPRQTKAGVSVLIKGRRVLIPHAFLKSIRGTLAVWARGTYNANQQGAGTAGPRAGKRRKRGIREATGRSAFAATGEGFGRFAFGRHRFPIAILRSTTPPAALMNPDVIEVMNARIEEQAPSVIKNAVKFAAKLAGF